ncbi:MAG: alpha/beta fold hydrolase [Cytophagales bacterium]|nr:alpha/beta fold hydrolase [Cytophagales bacterium]
MKFELKQAKSFKYIDEGHGSVMLLLHGLFGALSNWDGVISHFSKHHRVIIPWLPILEMPVKEATIDGLTDFIENFVNEMGLTNMILLGNSLGGHIALVYTLRHPNDVQKIILTGSSGLFENAMGGSYPRRGDRNYVVERIQYTFYDPNVVTQELIEEVWDITNNIRKGLNIVSIAKSAQRQNLAEELYKISHPVYLVWGLNDTITPPPVAHEFNRLLSNSSLHFIDKCGHAPMMEHPDYFNVIIDEFIKPTVAA